MLRFGLEAVERLGVGGELGSNELEGDETFRIEVERLVNLPIPPRPSIRRIS